MHIPAHLRLKGGMPSRMLVSIEHRPENAKPWSVYARYAQRNEHLMHRGAWFVSAHTTEKAALRAQRSVCTYYNAVIDRGQ